MPAPRSDRLGPMRMLASLLAARPDAAVPRDSRGWDALVELAAAHDLMPALWVALRDAGHVVTIPADALAAIDARRAEDRDAPALALQRAYDANRARQQVLLDSASRLLDGLAATGTSVVPLKGLHTLLVGLWPDPGARTMVDIDLLAASGSSDLAFMGALAVGFERTTSPPGEYADHQLATLCDPSDVYLEVHEHVLRTRWDRVLPVADVFAAASERDGPHGRHLLMSDTHAVVTLVAHGQLQDDTYRRLEVPLRALLETDRWIRHRGTGIDWVEVARRFDDAGEGAALAAHLGALRRWFGTPSPLERRRGHGTRGRVHDELTVVALRAPAAKRAVNYLSYLPRSFETSRMLAQYGTPSGPLWVWRARARHAGKRVAEHTSGVIGRTAERSRRAATQSRGAVRRRRLRIRRRWRRTFVELNHDWRRTILVVGSGRSGTTWLAEVINHRRDHRFVFEPFRANITEAAAFSEGEYLPPGDADAAHRAGATAILSGRVRAGWTDRYNRSHVVRRRLVKCIRITNLVPWFEEQFPGLRIVYIVRHPCAVAVSRARNGFPDGVDEMRAHEALCLGPLAPYAGEIERVARSGDRFERDVLAWCMQNRVPLTESRPDLHVVCWEHLVTAPDRELARLEATTGIPMRGERVRRTMARPGSIRGDDGTFTALREGRTDGWLEHVDAERRARAAEIVASFDLGHVYGPEPEPRCTGAELPAAGPPSPASGA